MKAIYISIGIFVMWSVGLLLAPSTPIFIGWTIIIGAVAANIFLGVGRLMFNAPPEWDADKPYRFHFPAEGEEYDKPYVPPGRYVRASFTGDGNGNIELSNKSDSGFVLKRGKIVYPSYWRRVVAWLQRKPAPAPKVEPPTVTFKSAPANGSTVAAIYETDFTAGDVDNDTQKMLTVYSLKTGGNIFYTNDPWSLTDKLCSVHVENMNPRQRIIVEISCELMNEKDYQEVSRGSY